MYLKKQYLPQKAISTSTSIIYLNKQYLPQQAISTSKSNIYLNKQYLPQQAISTSTSNSCLKKQYLPQKQYLYVSNIYLKKQYQPQKAISTSTSNIYLKKQYLPQQANIYLIHVWQSVISILRLLLHHSLPLSPSLFLQLARVEQRGAVLVGPRPVLVAELWLGLPPSSQSLFWISRLALKESIT